MDEPSAQRKIASTEGQDAWTTLKVLDWTTQRFEREGIASPRLDAQVLLAHVLRCDRIALYANFDKPLAKEELAAYRALIQRRLAGEPVAYLTGQQEFWSMRFAVDARVLIPRADTETLVQAVLDLTAGRKDQPLRIAEIATGSGAVVVALAKERKTFHFVATDVSADALAVAQGNLASHGLLERVELRQGDLLAPLSAERFDGLVANLPYIARADIAGLDVSVRHEPVLALDGGDSGLELIERLVGGARAVIEPGGFVALEHGFDQGEAVAEIARRAGATEIESRADLGGRARVTVFHCGA